MSQNISFEICDIEFLIEKAETVLDTLENELFDDVTPQVDSYKYNYDRHVLNAHIIRDYLHEAKKTIKVLEEAVN
ncbi:MAG: hypothetical protein SOY97_06080 [Candidatus Metalachnospira sp.]|nr:hypothetical protein [Candidatus Metalachnospira sp.]